MKNKKNVIIILLSLLILGIIITIVVLFNKNKYIKLNVTTSYDDVTYTLTKYKKSKKEYLNVIVLENKSKDQKELERVTINFYDKNNDLLEEIYIVPGTLKANERKELEFISKNDLSLAKTFEIKKNHITDVSKTFRDDKFQINDFIEGEGLYLFNIKNISKEKIETNDLTIAYLDENKEVVFTTKFSVNLEPNMMTTLSTKKGNINPNKIKYLEVISY